MVPLVGVGNTAPTKTCIFYFQVGLEYPTWITGKFILPTFHFSSFFVHISQASQNLPWALNSDIFMCYVSDIIFSIQSYINIHV